LEVNKELLNWRMHFLKSTFLFAILAISYFPLTAQKDYTKLVNPMVGTGGHGHTFPGPVVPFGMVQVGPDTRVDGSWDGCSGYHYSDSIIYGFSHTHLSGTGCSDYGDIMIMPINRNHFFTYAAETEVKNYASKFSHTNETASPGYYAVTLDKSKVKVELTASNRAAKHRYTFKDYATPAFILDLNHRDQLLQGKVTVVNDSTVEGYRYSKAWATNQKVYFRMVFSKKFKAHYMFSDSSIKLRNMQSNGKLKVIFEFPTGTQNIEVTVALSGVSEKGAAANYSAEAASISFDQMRKMAQETWNKELSKIEVKGGTIEQQRIFYTALYHCFIHPSTASDVDHQFYGRDGKIYPGDAKNPFTYYTVFSLWDTFRALHPLFNLVQRERNLDFIKTFLEQNAQVNRMPMWELSSNETDCMIGYHAVSVLTDAYAKGIRNFDTDEAWQACENTLLNHRYGATPFRKQHYLSIEDESESVSKTLEYAYNHWCLNQFENMSGRSNANLHHDGYAPGAEWQALYNPKNNFIQPRSNGTWFKPFKPAEVNNYYTEANAWQYSTFVPQDIEGLIMAYGGTEKFEKHLDALFSASSKTEGREQADITGLIGQYAHGNEPSHHMAYLYNFTGNPIKTKKLVNQIMAEMYHDAPDGLSGNEDCGQMSAWYVLSAIGFYPVTPGIANYQMGYPLFDEVIFNLENKTSIQYKKSKHPQDLNYQYRINKGTWTNSSTLKHSDLFPLHTSDEKNYAKTDKLIPIPVIEGEGKVFKDSMRIEMYSNFENKPIYYCLQGLKDTSICIEPKAYKEPFYIYNSCTIKAHIEANANFKTYANASFIKSNKPFQIELKATYNSQYTAGGNNGLIDGLQGDVDWRKGNWQGYQGQDFEAIVDLKTIKKVNQINSRYLQDQRSWIFLPNEVVYSYSEDGITYKEIQASQLQQKAQDDSLFVRTIDCNLKQAINARFIKIYAKNYGLIPSWHPGAGGESFIFIDEIDLN